MNPNDTLLHKMRFQTNLSLKQMDDEFEMRESIRVAQEKLRIEREKERIAILYSHLPVELRPSVLVRDIACRQNKNVNDIDII